MKNLRFYISFLVPFVLLFSCSSERNTWTSKAYHNTTAHFNGYFYASEEIRKIEETIQKSQADDYNRILMLFATFDSTLAKGYEKEVEEAIKMASIAIQRHPNSKWVDDAYILVGKARLYSLDWGNAIQTFKYTNTKASDRSTRHLAIIHLIRTYTEHQEFNNARAAIDYLEKVKLSRTNKKKFHLEKAYFNQVQEDYDNMVRSLTAADHLLKKSDRKGRIYFIIAQVYQKLGFEAEAYNYYKKCLATNPEYEVDFYARLYMAQVTEISRSRNVNAARKSFRKLLKDSKNKEFRDKIFYEMGVFELKQNNISEAIENFNHSIRSGNNKRIGGEAYLRLGEVYYDTLKNYELSQAYYDSAIQALPPDYEGYARIKTRQEILNEFVQHLKTIQWQDSLLSLSHLDSAGLHALVDSALTARKNLEASGSGKKKRPARVVIETQPPNTFFSGNANASEGVDWYFGNPSAMALGQSEFKRVWGDIELDDNWRRSQRITSTARAENNPPGSQPGNENTSATQTEKEVDPVALEYTRLDQQIPRTEEAKTAALTKIENAYFRLGEIYYFKLQENKNAIDVYEKLLGRFPESDYEPEVLYTLYLITKETDSTASRRYAGRLQSEHPNSTFAKILINPEYLKESGLAAEKQKDLYKSAYEIFEGGHYDSARTIIRNALRLGETSFAANLRLLQVLITGKTEDITRYQFELGEFIEKYPDAPVTGYAQKLLETSREFQLTEEKKRGIRFIPSLNEPHYFVLVYRKKDKIEETTTSQLENFNDSFFKKSGLKTSNLILNDDFTLTFVSTFSDSREAMEYFAAFSEKLPSLPRLRNLKFNKFVITKDNFDIFYRTKGLDEYLQFFEKTYPTENQ